MYSYKLVPYKPIVKQLSNSLFLDEFLIYAMILQETGGDPYRTRFEPNYYEKNKVHLPNIYAPKLGISVETEKVQQCMSWGLMQVLGVVAREFGYMDHLTKLTDPEAGIVWGVKKLDKCLFTYKESNLAISAYNHGTPVDNDPYVKSVNTYLGQLKGENVL